MEEMQLILILSNTNQPELLSWTKARFPGSISHVERYLHFINPHPIRAK